MFLHKCLKAEPFLLRMQVLFHICQQFLLRLCFLLYIWPYSMPNGRLSSDPCRKKLLLRALRILRTVSYTHLCIVKLEDGYVLASESCALDAVGAQLIREIDPGEIIVIENNEINCFKYDKWIKPKRCIFELIYFARPDSELEGVSVYAARHRAGEILAEADKDDTIADVVIGVPDSGIPAAIGYANRCV